MSLLRAISAETKLVKLASRLHARDHAPAFNFFTVVAPFENQLSRLFAWLLDPIESHGQGDIFLKSFLRAFWPNEASSLANKIEVTLEARCYNIAEPRRIDILVEAPDFILAIENKPWAQWQKRQLEAYHEELEARCTQRSSLNCKPFRLLALVGGTRDAIKEAHTHWKGDRAYDVRPFPDDCICAHNYEEVAEWIGHCAAEARPPMIGRLLRDLEVYCQAIMTGDVPLPEDEAVKALLANAHSEQLAAAFRVQTTLPSALTHRLELVCTNMQTLIRGVEVAVEKSLPNDSLKGLRVREPHSPIPIFFGLLQGSDSQAWVGIQSGSWSTEALEREVGKSGALSSAWAWWRYLRKDELLDHLAWELPVAELARVLTAVTLDITHHLQKLQTS